jgi:hypothetical protein
VRPTVRARKELTTRNGDYRELTPYVELRAFGRRLWDGVVLAAVVMLSAAGITALFVLLE